jgi:hypothetical protein
MTNVATNEAFESQVEARAQDIARRKSRIFLAQGFKYDGKFSDQAFESFRKLARKILNKG